jgi:hypothetical protein
VTDLASAVADRPGLDVTAELSVSVDGTAVDVESYTDRLLVDVDSVCAIARLAAATGGRSRIRRTSRLLAAADLTAELRVAGRPIALLGADAVPGVLGRRLGGVELRTVGLVAAAFTTP